MRCLQLSVGDRAKIKIPAALGYGPKGFPGLVEGNQEIMFDVEMLSCVEVDPD